MEIKELQIFIDLAQTLHFGRTAEKHFISAPALSRWVQRLEARVGVGLLQRNNRRVALTPAGQRYLQFARECLAAWQSFENDMGISVSNLTGSVSLFCSVTASHSLISGVLSGLRAAQPQIEVDLHTGDQADSIARVLNGRDDFAVAAKPEKLDRQLAFATLARTELKFIAPLGECAPQREIARGRKAGHIDWQGLPWIVAEQGESRRRLDRWFRAQKIKPSIYAQVTGHEAIVSMVALGCGVGLVPELVLASSPVSDSIQIIEDVKSAKLTPYGEFEIGLCTLQHRLDEPLMRAVWQSTLDSQPSK
ncbi:MAG: HTH-type transcriptional activator IlvY [Gammaproteobacteria bacterium]|nr:HTH-type transcriptional activator IlvY [Gammaproteobacteria bacterium]NND38004.1 HTH-type transcriptional activator IlvY [Pseudomonadales bacterium]MBT8150729.1 HTH-type transcriptional activator IlvY [Gammaproteobacteria bacterium]NNL10280.1 HTH-type transcriptional activator IlvY [Pseudomonadales bacterium]NNM12272.1 HTH-type transcriptional activator IlvY [Pseudomonadales bacterium]